MPDWFYRTVAQPCLFRLPDALARSVALGTIGVLGKSKIGCGLIDFLGHMKADSKLAFEKRGYRFASPIGIGWRVDPECRATRGLARFGIGSIEILDKRQISCHRTENGGLADKRCKPIESKKAEINDILVFKRMWRSDGREVVALPGGEELEVYSISDNIVLKQEDILGVVLQIGDKLEDGL